MLAFSNEASLIYVDSDLNDCQKNNKRTDRSGRLKVVVQAPHEHLYHRLFSN